VIEEVLGVEEKEVKGLRLRDVTTGEESTLPSADCFSASATSRMRKMFAGQIDLDDDGYIRTTGNVLVTQQRRGGSGRLCLRRRAGPALSAGDYRGRVGLHGGAGGGEVSRRSTGSRR
jgi:hypothetical protein